MNYLAHFYLSDDSPQALVGSLLGDFAKGTLDQRYGTGIRNAIVLHRKIDTYTDTHARVRMSRNRATPNRRRFAGIMVDVFYDHFLVKHWTRYSTVPLADFSRHVYSTLLREHPQMPAGAQSVVRRMADQDWLTSYGDLRTVDRALNQISGRLSRKNTLVGAAEELTWNYPEFESDFLSFFPEVMTFAARTIRESTTE